HVERGGTHQARDAARVAQAVASDVVPEAGHRTTVPLARGPTPRLRPPILRVDARRGRRRGRAARPGARRRAARDGARGSAPRHAVVRLAGLYAAGGAGFADRVLARARTGGRLRVVHDQVTAPTWARDVAAALARLLPRLVGGDAPGGVYHLTNAGACSWYE